MQNRLIYLAIVVLITGCTNKPISKNSGYKEPQAEENVSSESADTIVASDTAFAGLMAQTMALAYFSASAEQFFTISGRWPKNVEDLMTTPIWKRDHPDVSHYESIEFREQTSGELIVNLRISGKVMSKKVARPKNVQ